MDSLNFAPSFRPMTHRGRTLFAAAAAAAKSDLSAVLGDGGDANTADFADGAYLTSDTAVAVSYGDEQPAGTVLAESSSSSEDTSYRRAKSPTYTSSSARMRTPYERPSADTYRPSGGAGDSGGGGGASEDAGGGPTTSAATAAGDRYGHGGGGGGGRRPSALTSRRECRVYVGNLAYEVGWQELKDHMRKAGDVLFADVLTQPNGRSKGCGVVEFAAPEEAQRAIRELNDTSLLGRSIFVREDREQEAKFGAGRDGRYGSGGGGGGSYRPSGGGGGGSDSARSVYVGNLPYIVAWQDLKDLFRQAGPVFRADVHEGPDRRSRGTGTVVFDSVSDAQNAISTFNGYEWHGRRLEVRFVMVVARQTMVARGIAVAALQTAVSGTGAAPPPPPPPHPRPFAGGGGGGYRDYGGPPYDYYGRPAPYDPYAYGAYGYGAYNRGYGAPPPPPTYGGRADYYKDYGPPPMASPMMPPGTGGGGAGGGGGGYYGGGSGGGVGKDYRGGGADYPPPPPGAY
ncbi:hypothetical protein HK405_002959, partial [Cladochytrium tenue]